MSRCFGFFLVIMFAALGFSVVAQAAEPRLLRSYGDWDAYIFSEGAHKVCYMASRPKKEEGNYTRRGDVYALITHRPGEGTKDVFSYITGYNYKAGSGVTVSVGDKKFVLFTQDSTAWAPDAQSDTAIAKAVRAGSKMIVQGVSSRGTKTKDTFGLKGSSAAYERITQECAR